MPASIPPSEQDALRAEAVKTIQQAVIPAYAELLKFFNEEYVPKARKTLAAESLPDGKEFYQSEIRRYTTLDLTPDQIHKIGLAEVARIHAEMIDVMQSTGYKGDFHCFLDFLRTDPQFKFEKPEYLLWYGAWVVNEVNGKIGQYIGLLPRGRFAIQPVPANIAPFYTAGRGGAGSCLLNTYDLPSRPSYNLGLSLCTNACRVTPSTSLSCLSSRDGQISGEPARSRPSAKAGRSMTRSWASRWESIRLLTTTSAA
jgi:uncharacterized protein (DUF885 family)